MLVWWFLPKIFHMFRSVNNRCHCYLRSKEKCSYPRLGHEFTNLGGSRSQTKACSQAGCVIDWFTNQARIPPKCWSDMFRFTLVPRDVAILQQRASTVGFPFNKQMGGKAISARQQANNGNEPEALKPRNALNPVQWPCRTHSRKNVVTAESKLIADRHFLRAIDFQKVQIQICESKLHNTYRFTSVLAENPFSHVQILPRAQTNLHYGYILQARSYMIL